MTPEIGTGAAGAAARGGDQDLGGGAGRAHVWNVGVILAGGTAPVLCVWLVEVTGSTLVPAFFVMGVAVVGLLSIAAIVHGPRPGRVGG